MRKCVWKTLVHEFHIFYSHTEWYLLLSDSATTRAQKIILCEMVILTKALVTLYKLAKLVSLIISRVANNYGKLLKLTSRVSKTSRAEPILYCWHDLLFPFLSPTVLFFSSFHGLVVWGWGLWTDSVLTLSRPCTADSK